MPDTGSRAVRVIENHERSKHHPHRYARSPGFLDWDNEPEPFRHYEGTSTLKLPLLGADPESPYIGLYERKSGSPGPLALGNIAAFLELSLGLSAWKSYGGNSWALRMNPSSGNLHPTECHLMLPPLIGEEGGVFHYDPYSHALERRSRFGPDLWYRLAGDFPAEGFFVALSSIVWREAWKYGERAFRYSCQDIGHALACVSFSAGLHGWKATYVNALSDEEVGILLGFDRTRWEPGEEEIPQCLLYIQRGTVDPVPRDVPAGAIESFKGLPFMGAPNIFMLQPQGLAHARRGGSAYGKETYRPKEPYLSVT